VRVRQGSTEYLREPEGDTFTVDALGATRPFRADVRMAAIHR